MRELRDILRPVVLLLVGVGLAGCATTARDARRDRWEPVFAAPATATSTTAATRETGTEALHTISEILDLAQLRNPGLRAEFDRWTVALEQVPQASSLPDPRISYAEFLQSVETRVGPQERKVGLSQTIPLFGKRGLRGEVANYAAVAAGNRFERERLDLQIRLIRLWNDYHCLGQSVTITEENVQLVGHFESVALAEYSAGKAPYASVLRAQVELGRLEDQLRSLRDRRGSMVAALNVEIDRPANAPIDWPVSLAEPSDFDDEADLESLLRSNNPQIAILQAEVDRQSAASRLANKNRIPDLTLGIEYIGIGEAISPDSEDSGKDAAMAMASINLPLWSGRTGAERAQARARSSAADRDLQQAHSRLLARLELARFEFRDASRRVELYELTLLPKARESLEVTEDSFVAGKAGFFDLIDTQRTLLEFQLAHQRALADRATRSAELATLVGIDPLTTSTRRNTP